MTNKLIVENDVVLDDVVACMEDAQLRFDKLNGLFESSEIRGIIESLAKTEQDVAVAMCALLENMPLNEFIVKRVNSKGEMTRIKDKETRKRQATQTTGLSKSKRRQIARKAAKTRKANPGDVRKSVKRRKKAMDKRKKMYGLDK